MQRAQRVSRLAILALGVAFALTACILVEPVTGAGEATYEDPTAPFPMMSNPNVELFSCYGDYVPGVYSLEATGQCKAHYQGTGIIAHIPQACLNTSRKYYTAFQTPTTSLGPIVVRVLQDGTGQELATVADAGAAPWSYYTPGFPRSQKGIVATGVIFTTSGPGTLTRGGAQIDTAHIPVQDTYRVEVTCATNWDATTNVVTRETDTGSYTPT